MDLTLIRTFLQVSQTGSFLAASNRLFVTQSAVSLRIQKLEEEVGKPLFERTRAGAVLSLAGRQFEPYALAIMRSWHDARQQIALPEGFTGSFAIGAQASLWPELGDRWLDALNDTLPELSLRAKLGLPDGLAHSLNDGLLQALLTYEPILRPTFVMEPFLDDILVLVAPWASPTMDSLSGRYAYIDWNENFLQFHQTHMAHVQTSGMSFAIGVLSIGYLIRRGVAGFLPARFAARYIREGRLHVVADAPQFICPVWALWRQDLDPQLQDAAKKTLLATASAIKIEVEGLTDTL